MTDAVFSLKVGKSTSTFVKAEHIFSGCPELLCYIHLLFNALLIHSYLPYEFLCGTISPLVKDGNGDTTDSSNYRAVTLGPIFAQIFEYALLKKYGHYLECDELQFGFKKSHSTSHAIFVLKSTVEYFTEHGSNVFVTFLDCSKAFDTVSHYGIYLKLMNRGVPLLFLKLVIYWYSNMKSQCRWGDAYSSYFDCITGTKQGGVLSPIIFTLYMDDLIRVLRKRGTGCHILSLFVACLMYADDLCLLAPTRSAMQQMLDICSEFCDEYCLSFNVKKSKGLLFGKLTVDSVSPLFLNEQPIEYVPEWKYLGSTIVSGRRLSFSIKPSMRNFYCSANSVLRSIRRPNDLVLMSLLYSICVPGLTYAAEVIELSSREMNDCNVALNDAIRRIFSYNRWESTRLLRQQLGYSNITEIFHARRERFIAANRKSGNSVIKALTILCYSYN